MAEKALDSSEPLDVQRIHYLVRLMKRYDLTDLNISDGQVQIRLKRRGPESASSVIHLAPAQAIPAAGAHPYPVVAAHPVAAPAPRPEGAATEPPAGPRTIVIRSPMVGTYYASSAPDAPPFVTVGSVVQPDSTVCIIEAMKVFTDIPAGASGTIAEILVKNGQPVEFDQPLFRVLPA
jgi:acetyl-CoA carboxylase biotin carboxyl carrier protein